MLSMQEEGEETGEEGGAGYREEPCAHNVARDAPAHGGNSPRSTGAHNGRRDDMRAGETGIPRCAASRMEVAAQVSAEKP